MTAAPTLDSVCLTAADDGFLDLDSSGLEVLGEVMEFSSVLVLHSDFPFEFQTIVFVYVDNIKTISILGNQNCEKV